jgi:hypothetical protein
MRPGRENGTASSCEEPAQQAHKEELETGKKYQDELQTAQLLFEGRRFQEAEQILVPLAAQNDPHVEALLEVVRQARAATEEEQFYKSGREKALTLIQQQEFEQAADLLCNLLSLFPGDSTLETDLRYAQDREPNRGEDTVRVTEKLNEGEPCGLQAEPEKPSRPPVETKVPVAGPAHVRWPVIAAALFLLVSATAAVWKFSHNEFPAVWQTLPRPDFPQLPVTRQARCAASSRAGSCQELKFMRGASSPPFEKELVIYGELRLTATVDKRGRDVQVTILSGEFAPRLCRPEPAVSTTGTQRSTA